MPLVQINVFKGELNQDQSKELIARVTDVITDITSEKLRDVTWVMIKEVESGYWGVGGNTLRLSDVKKMMAD